MRFVLTIFAPALTAIVIRALLGVIGIILELSRYLLSINSSAFRSFIEGLCFFETFDWNESWAYWVLVIIGSFFAEMAIWEDN